MPKKRQSSPEIRTIVMVDAVDFAAEVKGHGRGLPFNGVVGRASPTSGLRRRGPGALSLCQRQQ